MISEISLNHVDIENMELADFNLLSGPRHNMKLMTVLVAKGREFEAATLIPCYNKLTDEGTAEG